MEISCRFAPALLSSTMTSQTMYAAMVAHRCACIEAVRDRSREGDRSIHLPRGVEKHIAAAVVETPLREISKTPSRGRYRVTV